MAKRKTKFEVKIIDGVKHVIYEAAPPRPSELTWPIGRSRYTAWHQGVLKAEVKHFGVRDGLTIFR